jgi:hypothetical protein
MGEELAQPEVVGIVEHEHRARERARADGPHCDVTDELILEPLGEARLSTKGVDAKPSPAAHRD